ncbi:hypothetical protein Cri9333_0700 [Crinalium epipsammum PCC 9333]|uniref:Uncharacterized protein n=1 Tax=Crinalium epipsammum PCC 9333 TaxID=1173022 RepID=K9VVX1_9CYAN|nr:hypothetical protein [Crinalium epipsammum]AFZ11632.1 hypothetical protein Cri9333_0700 [Crinalium epipsammum PCC 9333]
MKLLTYAFLSYISAILLSNSASANPVQEESILCKNKKLLTMLAFSTSEYNIAICKESLGGFHYIHQNRKNKTQIFLPVIKKNDPYSGVNPWLLKASKGGFTYQVANFNPLGKNGSVSISIFKNGRKIYHRITKNFIRSDE